MKTMITNLVSTAPHNYGAVLESYTYEVDDDYEIKQNNGYRNRRSTYLPFNETSEEPHCFLALFFAILSIILVILANFI